MKTTIMVTILSACFLSAASAAPFTGEAELGYVMTNGNTKTQSLTAKAKGAKEYDVWRHNVSAEALNASSRDMASGQTNRTAEKYAAQYKADYKLSEHGYVFGLVNYEDDRFSGYDYRSKGLFGYGRDLHKTDTLLVNAELAAGMRQSKLDNGDSDDEAIARILGHVNWKVSDTSVFDEELTIEPGEEQTIYKSITGLKVKINTSLAMKATYTIKHTTDVPVGVRETDSETTLTLVYSY